MKELYDCYHTGVGFVVPGRCFAYSHVRPSIPTQKVSINIIPYSGFGKSSGALCIGRVWELHGSYLGYSPRFCFPEASPPKLQRYLREWKSKSSLALPPGDLGKVELATGRGACEYIHPTQSIVTCGVEASFDKQGLFLRFSGELDSSDDTDPELHSLHYCAEASIEWRVLRFIFDIHFVQIMYSSAMDE